MASKMNTMPLMMAVIIAAIPLTIAIRHTPMASKMASICDYELI